MSNKKETKEIKIERKNDVEQLLAKAKAKVEMPMKKVERRGRPKKPRPDPTLAKYHNFPLAVEINKAIAFTLNSTFTKPNLMQPHDTQIGEALMYTGEYYGWVVFDHPIMILTMAIAGTTFTAWQKREAAKKMVEESG